MNHVVKFLGIFAPPPSWSLLQNKAYEKMVIWLTPLNCPRGLWMSPTTNFEIVDHFPLLLTNKKKFLAQCHSGSFDTTPRWVD